MAKLWWLSLVALKVVHSFHFSCSRWLHLSFGTTSQIRNDLKRSCLSSTEKNDAISVEFVEQTEHYLVVSKPASVVCHHSDWTGSRKSNEVPMLQRIRVALDRKINLVHRLDRGASGCLLVTYSNDGNSTAVFQRSMSENHANKTYIALVRGEGILHGRDFRKEGWFLVDRPIKDENGELKEARTLFRFIAGQDDANGTRPRASLVLARPLTGRWHQIRRHLNGLSHPILGDSTHGNSRTNREWRSQRGLANERTCLHLVRLQLPPNEYCPNGMNVTCPLAPDMMTLLEQHLPAVMVEASDKLQEENLCLADVKRVQQ